MCCECSKHKERLKERGTEIGVDYVYLSMIKHKYISNDHA